MIFATCLAVTKSSAQAGSAANSSVLGVFVAATPSHDLIRPLLQIPAGADCDLVKWELTLYHHPQTFAPTTYSLRSEYGFYINNSTYEKRGTYTTAGTWAIVKNVPGHPDAVFYTLDPDRPKISLSFLRLNNNVIHVTNSDKSLMIGNGGWSFSLNRKDPIAMALVNQTIPSSAVDRSLTQIVFHGRTPCQEIARVSAIPTVEDCIKIKWLLTLNYDPATHDPTTFSINHTLHRQGLITGTWTILRGTKTNLQATVYRLDTDKPEESIYLLQADKNVLFFLDKDLNPLSGNQDFAYTLNFKSKQ